MKIVTTEPVQALLKNNKLVVMFPSIWNYTKHLGIELDIW